MPTPSDLVISPAVARKSAADLNEYTASTQAWIIANTAALVARKVDISGWQASSKKINPSADEHGAGAKNSAGSCRWCSNRVTSTLSI